MRNGINRIKSERGASILAALLLVLVLTTVSAIILIYASADYGRLPDRLAEKQEKTALVSAASLIRDELDQQSVTVKTTTTTVTTYDYWGNVTGTSTNVVREESSSDPSGMIGQFASLPIFAGTSESSSLAATLSVDKAVFTALEADISLYKNDSDAIIVEADLHPADDSDHIYVYWAVSDSTSITSSSTPGSYTSTYVETEVVTYTFSAETITEVKNE
ncbi:MAG TPA: hypothetical protein PLU75_09460 [Oscillospiraceae bacterium]|nr:hypothetical protein [Oscillospiraceae bacterium]HQQ89976.1 hypothetical protein [Oscillospiraceae bacterium]HRW57459.1 hypothetical protein [Oscillospiraceae bacterium]